MRIVEKQCMLLSCWILGEETRKLNKKDFEDDKHSPASFFFYRCSYFRENSATMFLYKKKHCSYKKRVTPSFIEIMEIHGGTMWLRLCQARHCSGRG